MAVRDDGSPAVGFVGEDCFRGFGDCGCLFPGNDNDTVGVADDDVAGKDRNAAEGDGCSEAGGAVLVGTGRCGGACEDRHTNLGQGLGIAGRPVQGEAGKAEVDGAFSDKFPEKGP